MKRITKCSDCGTSLKQNNKDKHECGEAKCFVCGKTYMSHEEHLCYLRAKSSDIEPEKFIFYDFECTQENGNHVPNFVVAQSICPKCEDDPITEKATCNNCGSRCTFCDKFNKRTIYVTPKTVSEILSTHLVKVNIWCYLILEL